MADKKTNELLEQLFEILPNRKSANVKALEDMYEKGNEPYLYGSNDLKGYRTH